jgi:hypothetical protein
LFPQRQPLVYITSSFNNPFLAYSNQGLQTNTLYTFRIIYLQQTIAHSCGVLNLHTVKPVDDTVLLRGDLSAKINQALNTETSSGRALAEVIVDKGTQIAVVPAALRCRVWNALVRQTGGSVGVVGEMSNTKRSLAEWEVNAAIAACCDVLHVGPSNAVDDTSTSTLADEAAAAVVQYCENTGANVRTPLASLAVLVVSACHDSHNNAGGNAATVASDEKQELVQSLLTQLAQQIGGFLCNDTFRLAQIQNEIEFESVLGLSHDGAHLAWERQLAPHVAIQARGFIRSLLVYHDPSLCLHLDHHLRDWFTPSLLPSAPLHDQLAELTAMEHRRHTSRGVGGGDENGNRSSDIGNALFGLFVPEGNTHLAKVLTDALLVQTLPGFATAQSAGVFAALALLLLGRERLLAAASPSELIAVVRELRTEAVGGSETNARRVVQVATAAASVTPSSFVEDVLGHELLLVPVCTSSPRAARSHAPSSASTVPEAAVNQSDRLVESQDQGGRGESDASDAQQTQPTTSEAAAAGAGAAVEGVGGGGVGADDAASRQQDASESKGEILRSSDATTSSPESAQQLPSATQGMYVCMYVCMYLRVRVALEGAGGTTSPSQPDLQVSHCAIDHQWVR